MLNRSAISLRYKQPMVEWINNSDPYESPEITFEEANKDRTVYLIYEDESDDYEKWISANYKQLFESELEGWYADETLWPKKRTRQIFNKWFEVDYHSIVIDTVGEDIIDDEM